ncbi:MAG: LytTR family transcriptional regulator DNA-binding domain-containing protein [Hyphomonadaceae bacterium]|nr:LytTR family transcriptional regulator DNA-binding domain-containing protein [Hyphomonadaceae bacterium]
MRGPADPIRETTQEAVGEAPDAGDPPPNWQAWARNLGIAGAAGAFLAFVGAMGTGQTPLLTRLLYWAPLMMAGGVLGNFTALLVARIPNARMNPWLFGAILALVMSVPSTLFVWGYTNLVFAAHLGVGALPALFGSVLVICCAMTALMVLVNWPGRVTHAPAAGAAPAAVRFLERLPPKLKGAVLYAVSAEDHYLRLHTSKGSDLILMRLADAIAELDGLEGAQTHRSWWVAREAVESARREGDRAVLVLKGGAEAPVSRPNVRPLREAGWL